MTPEAQRIAIAEACGWKLMHCKYHGCSTWHSPDNICADGDDYPVLPPYLTDLNAMHEAEKTLDTNQQLNFACYLTQPVRDEIYEVMPNNLHYTVCYPPIHATAAQRAEAFLRTLNLWAD